MNYTLLIFSIVTPKELSFRYFVSDKDWYEELHTKINYNMYSKAEAEEAIVNLGLKEISFEEIKDYSFKNTMSPVVYDGIDDYNEDNTFHYTVDYDEEDWETLLYGCGYDFEIHSTLSVDDILNPILGKFNGEFDESAETVYLIPRGGSLDEEYALVYNAFTNEKDVELFLSLFAKGEIAPYIFMNEDYCVAVQMHPALAEIKCIQTSELADLLKTKNVVIKQPIFDGRDIYN